MDMFLYLIAGLVGAVVSHYFLHLVGMSPDTLSDNMSHIPRPGLAVLATTIVFTTVGGNYLATTSYLRVAVPFFVNLELWLGIGLLVHLYLRTKRMNTLMR